MHKVLDTPYVYLELQDDLLIGTYKKGLKMTLAIVKEIVKTRMEFTEYKPVVTIVYNAGVISMTKEARDYLSGEEGSRGFIAAALVLESPFSSFLGNFYLTVSKPRMPSKSFTKTSAALKWLAKYRK
jgi:hypothetical protein